MTSPLFKNFGNLAQKQARAEFRNSHVGRLLSEAERYASSGRLSATSRRILRKRLAGLTVGSISKAVVGTPTMRELMKVQRYAKLTPNAASVFSEVMQALGPIGSAVAAILRPGGTSLTSLDRELSTATDLLKAFGYKVNAPDHRPSAQRRSEAQRDAQAYLESFGFSVEPPKPKQEEPQLRSVHPQRRYPESVMVGGRRRNYAADDPTLTGDMIEVESSNVHSIGFIFDHDNPMKGVLKIRFLQGVKRSKRAGPMYYYYGVHPDVFTAFRAAASKGVFVWDRIRIRKTVSGHRYAYRLAGITGGYLPRQATRYGEKEYFIQRSATGTNAAGEKRQFRSDLPDRLVQSLEGRETGGRQIAVPNRASPSRGAPNRGR